MGTLPPYRSDRTEILPRIKYTYLCHAYVPTSLLLHCVCTCVFSHEPSTLSFNSYSPAAAHTLAHSGQLSRLLAISLAAIEQHATEEHSLRVTAVTRLATGARYPTGSPSYSWLQAIVSS